MFGGVVFLRLDGGGICSWSGSWLDVRGHWLHVRGFGPGRYVERRGNEGEVYTPVVWSISGSTLWPNTLTNSSSVLTSSNMEQMVLALLSKSFTRSAVGLFVPVTLNCIGNKIAIVIHS